MKRHSAIKVLASAIVVWLAYVESSHPSAAQSVEATPGSADRSRPSTDTTRPATAPSSRDALFDDEKAPGAAQERLPSMWRGYVQGELAYTFGKPAHWSQMLVRGELGAQGAFNDRVKWKIGARVDFNGVFNATDFYPSDVRKDQRFDIIWRENYVDVDAGDWDFRLGAQQIVWGEMVGLFFADVVSAKDLREFILPPFDVLRIPQWAARAEYSKNDFHAELVWIPVATYDNIGKPGAEFYPAVPSPPPGFATQFANENTPRKSLSNTNYGARLSTLQNGWDVSAFYYGSMDALPTFYREIVVAPQPAFIYQARHDRINQYGGTLAKDFGAAVLKVETIYTEGRKFAVLGPTPLEGVVPQNTLDWVIGLDFPLPSDTRLNLQLFQRIYFKHDPNLFADSHESGMTLLVNHKLTEHLEAEVLWIASLNRSEWMLRPRISWGFERNWRLALGVDLFQGPPLGLFGQFSNRDRVYTEVRYDF
jgi:hypothetical protein